MDISDSDPSRSLVGARVWLGGRIREWGEARVIHLNGISSKRRMRIIVTAMRKATTTFKKVVTWLIGASSDHDNQIKSNQIESNRITSAYGRDGIEAYVFLHLSLPPISPTASSQARNSTSSIRSCFFLRFLWHS